MIFGPNGAGKTTLIKIICGLLHGFEGRVRVNKKDIQSLHAKQVAQLISYQPQFDEFSLPLKVKEVLLSGRYPYKSFFKDYSKEDFHIYNEVVKRLKLEEFVDRDINTLSGGERKKVMIASAFIQDVSIIIFDEPFTFLDPGVISYLTGMMKEMNRLGKTLVVVSHDFEILYPLVNKMIALKNGKIVYSGNRVFDKEMLKKTYDASFERIYHNDKEIIFLDE